ncbi:hypothetical protein C8Q80DRAFT_1116385 [Daedaleopsis nitida]|nr:hypothetical protein C8Q80DRAFT_1116385 [Daedaleopsis nitida]
MPAPLDRESLKSMKRADLQRICKDYGIKANLKTEALIELLVDTTQALRPTPPPAPVRAPSNRIASRSTAIPRLVRGSSTSSVIIHDSDEEESALTEDPLASIPSAPPSEPELPPLPPPRPRRAKDTQYKLGVGRPTAAGGSGARTVTRSSSLSQKGKRGKGSKSAKPKEAAIQEEEEPDLMDLALPEAGPSGTTHEDPAPAPPAPETSAASPSIPDPPPEFAILPVPPSDTSDHMKAYITNLVTPLQTQIQLLQAELQQRSAQAADLTQLALQIRSLQTEVGTLRSQAALVPQLEAEIRQVKQLVAILTQAHAPSEKSLGKARASDEGGSETTIGRVESSHATPAMLQEQAFPGLAQSLLGKRQRDLNDSQVTDFVEAGQESNFSQEDLERRVVRPTKKRAKLSGEELRQAASSSGADPRAGTSQNPNGEAQSAPRAAFTIFQGPEEPPESYIDPPPPTTHLSDLLFGSEAGQITPPNGLGGVILRPPGADENAPNHMHSNYNFSFDTSLFDAVTSTPFDINLPPFTYPEPPTSPSPGAPSGGFIERAGGRIERNDLFQPIRRIPSVQASTQTPSRPQSAVGRTPSRMVARRESGQTQSLPVPSGIDSGETVDPSMLMAFTPSLSTVPEAQQEADTGPSVNVANGSIISSLARRTVSSTEIGIQLGMSSALPLPPDTPGAPMKRTMYGTELEVDTRFGDFGVEGIASGFWAGASRRV